MLANVTRCGASLALALLVLGQPSRGTADTSRGCPESNTQVVAQLFDRWNASLATGNPDAVAKLYADNAVLLPVLSDRLVVGKEKIRMHFAEFLARHPQVSVTERTISIDCATAMDIGTYVYRVTGRRKGTRMLIGGRYAIQYAFEGGDWRIVNHRTYGGYRPLSRAGDLTTTGIDLPGETIVPDGAQSRRL